jgi:hypothetical protein
MGLLRNGYDWHFGAWFSLTGGALIAILAIIFILRTLRPGFQILPDLQVGVDPA